MKIAVYISSHGIIKHLNIGFGHATRASVVMDELIKRGHTLYLMTDAPLFLFKDLSTIQIRKCRLLDPPIIQKNACINVYLSLSYYKCNCIIEEYSDLS